MGKRLEALYVRVFGRPGMQARNDAVLRAALRARGYNNFRNAKESGEEFFIRNILAGTKPRLCIDIGANKGSYSRMLLEATQATVISFEPLPQAFATLQAATRNFGERAIAVNKGVGEKNETLTLHYNPKELEHASFSEEVNQIPYVENQEQLSVDVVSLDDYVEANRIEAVDFIKIDTEGFEAEVLKGAMKTIARCKPSFIQIEFNWHQLFRNTSFNGLAELLPGYTAYQLLPKGWVQRDPQDSWSNFYQFSNFIFVRDGEN